MATSADVPNIYDIVIAAKGYIFANAVAPNLPFRTQRAKYGYTPTFVDRSNTSGGLGDEQQDFFFTVSQNNWSGGMNQQFFRAKDSISQSRFYDGIRNDTSIPGQVTLCRPDSGASAVNPPKAGAHSWGTTVPLSVSSATKTFSIDTAGTMTDRGLHGLGATPSSQCSSPGAIYVSTESAGTVGIRRLDATAWTYTTFSATGANKIAYLNNALYGLRCTASFDLITYSTAGAVTSLFTWKDANGTAMLPGVPLALVPVGGKLFIVFDNEVWLYDGTGCTKIWEFSKNFTGTDACQVDGVLFVSGGVYTVGSSTAGQVRYYSSGSESILYTDIIYGNVTKIAPWRNGVIFGAAGGLRISHYDLTTAAFSNIMVGSTDASLGLFVGPKTILVCSSVNGDLSIWPNTTTWSDAFAPKIISSWIDFESSLTKYFRSFQLIFDSGAAGNLTASIATDTGGAWSQGAVVSGTEYTPNITGKAARITIAWTNLAGQASVPTIKRWFLRAAPMLTQFRTGDYILDMTGRKGKTPVMLQNGNPHPLPGKDMLTAFIADATAGTVLSITDRLGTFNALVDLASLEVIELRPDEFYVRFSVKGV